MRKTIAILLRRTPRATPQGRELVCEYRTDCNDIRTGHPKVKRTPYSCIIRTGYSNVIRTEYSNVIRTGYSNVIRTEVYGSPRYSILH